MFVEGVKDMSLSSRSTQYGEVFSDWRIQKQIAVYGRVAMYQIVRNSMGWEETCALKAVPIISECGNYDKFSNSRREEYQEALSERKAAALREVQLVAKLSGRTNIVSYLDYKFVKWQNESGFGCDLLIRMELLRNLRGELLRDRIFSETEAIHVGMDICSALALCHRKNIVHRDIKPENIFFNDDGDYKLGGFGIAKILEPGSYSGTAIGTPAYVAPEQGSGRYDERVDIYSLGLVLYELRNRNRLPFASSSYLDDEDVIKRLHAETLPAPCDAFYDLDRVILKACAHAPEDRYQSAQDMLDVLRSMGY